MRRWDRGVLIHFRFVLFGVFSTSAWIGYSYIKSDDFLPLAGPQQTFYQARVLEETICNIENLAHKAAAHGTKNKSYSTGSCRAPVDLLDVYIPAPHDIYYFFPRHGCNITFNIIVLLFDWTNSFALKDLQTAIPLKKMIGAESTIMGFKFFPEQRALNVLWTFKRKLT